MKVVSTAKMSIRHQERLQTAYANHQFFFFSSIEEAGDEIRDAELLITYGEDLTPERVASMSSLRWIQVLSAGVDMMPLTELAVRGVKVTNASGIHKIPMAEYTIGVMLQATRKMNELYVKQQASDWDRSLRVEELYGKTLGIIGVGAIGEEIARRAQVFGMKVLGVTRSGKPNEYCDQMYRQSEFSLVLPQCDYVVVVVPLTEETYHLIGRAELEQMKESAVLINIARGPVIDEGALVEHLKADKLSLAVLDVFSQEPLPVDSPFWKLDNCIVTPHVSGRSPKYMERALEILHHNLALWDKGEQEGMMNVIEASRGY